MARVLLAVQQELFDHLQNEAGQAEIQEMLRFLRETPEFELYTPREDVIAGGRQIQAQRTAFEFTDGQIVAYLNQLEQDHRVVYTVDKKFDGVPGVTALPTPYNPYDGC